MKKKHLSLHFGTIVLFVYSICVAQNMTIDTSLIVPDIKGEIGLGFNYDFLRNPLHVPVDYPRGYLGFNLPLRYTLPQSIIGGYTSDISALFANGDQFEPQVSAMQNANTSIIIDVPMLGGVASFSNIQMMHLRYANIITTPSLEAGAKSNEQATITLAMRGIVNVPIEFNIGWETMTLGYLYKVNKFVSFAFNIHKHVFNFDIVGNVNVDILGTYKIAFDSAGISLNIPGNINYSLHNAIEGHYRLETWTPTFALQLWRFNAVSRFGINSKPTGFLKAQYAVPFFINPETFTASSIDADYLIGNLAKLSANATDSIEFSTTEKMEWKMPQAHTFSCDIFPEHLSVSYTKFVNSLTMNLYDPLCDKKALIDSTNKPDTLDFRFSAYLDHAVMIHCSLFSSFFNIGVVSMDFSFRDQTYMLSGIEELKMLRFDRGILTPILNFGTKIGSKIQVCAEFDVLPLIALKGGLMYYF